MWLLVGMTPIVIFPLKKWMILLYLIVLPGLGTMYGDSLLLLLLGGVDVEEIDEHMALYSRIDRNTGQNNIMGTIRYILSYGAFYTTIPIIFFKSLVNKHIEDKIIIMLSRLIIAVSSASLFFLFLNLDNNLFFYRILYILYILT